MVRKFDLETKKSMHSLCPIHNANKYDCSHYKLNIKNMQLNTIVHSEELLVDVWRWTYYVYKVLNHAKRGSECHKAKGMVPCTRPGPFCERVKKWVTSSKKWVISPILWRGTSTWGAGLFRFLTFQLNLVSDKTWHSMKVTANEGHHHLTFHM